MTSTTAAPASLTDRLQEFACSAAVVHAAFLDDGLALALADGSLILRAGDGASQRVAAHPDSAILCAATDTRILVTGGDDGRIVATDRAGHTQLLGDESGKWIDAVATRGGASAWSCGKTVKARDAKGKVRAWSAPSSVRGLAFAHKGYRLAIAHYNGASLWFPNTDAKPEALEWKGSHIDITWSLDGRFVVTTMQENQLHGWNVASKQHMRMSGYPAKVRSFSWSHDGLWLATSGADAAIIWPFQGEQGPMGKAPRECGVRRAKASAVAFHPGALVVAVGYEDGCILLCRLADGSELPVRHASAGSGRVISLAWDRQGLRLAFGSDDGVAGICTLPLQAAG